MEYPMNSNPEAHAKFYNEENLGFDLKLIEFAVQSYEPDFTGQVCLELGPASGYMTKFLVKYFEEVHVVEGSETLFNQLPDHLNLKKYHALFEKFNPDVQYDTIILNHVLEHIEEPVSLMGRIYDWLNDTGRVIVGVPNAKSFHRLAGVKMGLLDSEYELNERDIALGHHRVYDMELLKQHVTQAGFNVERDGGIFLKFLSNAQIETMLNDQIIEAYYHLSEMFKDNSALIYVTLKKQ